MNLSTELIKRAQQGDPAALEDVFGEVLGFLEDFIGTHVKSIADRDDLVQETLINISDDLPKYDLNRPFDDWVAGYAWLSINRYQSGEYFCGKRKQSVPDNDPPARREITFSEWLGDTEFEDIEGEIDPGRVII